MSKYRYYIFDALPSTKPIIVGIICHTWNHSGVKLTDSIGTGDPSMFLGNPSIKIQCLLFPEGPRSEDPNKLSRPTKRQYFHNSSEVASCNSNARYCRKTKKKRKKIIERERVKRGGYWKTVPVNHSASLFHLRCSRLFRSFFERNVAARAAFSCAPFNSTSFQNLGFHIRDSRCAWEKSGCRRC